MKHIAIDPSMLGAKNPKPCVAFDGYRTWKLDIECLSLVDSDMAVLATWELDTVIIEDGYVRFPKQAIGLAEARRRLEDAALRQGLTVHRLPITTWQAAMLGKGRKGKCKELSCKVASDLVKREITDDNAADAINMWFFIEMNPDFFETE